MKAFLEKMNVMDRIRAFPTYPGSVRYSIIFMYIGWISVFLTSPFLLDYKLTARELIAGVLVCYFSLLMRNWARHVCIMCNIMIMLLLIFEALILLLSGKMLYSMISLLCIAVFGISTFLFFKKSTSEYLLSLEMNKINS